ncbi:ANTAR domain-containing protein [Longispora albida]|uniref:ANTAR domain-containing protein n=1 Tax=Longispora albida TaxID=203523 RepID=UPI00037D8A5A|nr:ANTAR domain-containing protein [Longispora albida]
MTKQPPSTHPDGTDPVEALSSMVSRLRAERDGLRRAMRNRAVIEQAKGVLIERLGISPDEAFDQLVAQSSRSNVKLAEIAAALVATRVPGPGELPVASEPDGHERETRAAQPAVPFEEEALRAQHQLIAARVGSAVSPDEVAATIAESGVGWPEPDGVLLLTAEADGALGLLGASGLSAELRSQWDRVPPIQDLPIVAAAQTRSPVVAGDLAKDYPGGPPYPAAALAAFPLIADDRVIGVLALAWDTPVDLGDLALRYLSALADKCATRCAEWAVQGSRPDPSVLPLLVEALVRPAVALRPEYDADGQITDFWPECASPAARRLAEAEGMDNPEGSLMSALPLAGSQILMPILAEVLSTGESTDLDALWLGAETEGLRHSYLVDLHVARIWDRILMTWKVHGEPELLHELLLFGEEAAQTGSAWWSLQTEEIRWSPGLYRLAGRKPADGPITPLAMEDLVDPEDVRAIQSSIQDTLATGRTLSAELRGAGHLSGRRLRLTAEPKFAMDGSLRGILGTCQDITELTNAILRGQQAGVIAAAHRPRQVVAVTGAASDPGWHEIVGQPGGGTTAIIGNGGTPEIRQAALAYGLAGMTPAALLAALNTFARTSAFPGTMTATVLRVAPEGRLLTWAAAGDDVPVFRPADAEPVVLPGPLGLPVGATDGTQYPESQARLAPGDEVLVTVPADLTASLAAGYRPEGTYVLAKAGTMTP